MTSHSQYSSRFFLTLLVGCAACWVEPKSGDEPGMSGIVIACRPDDPSNKHLVCMHPDDAACSAQDNYVRRAICAMQWGGVPGDYPKADQASAYPGRFDCEKVYNKPPGNPEIRFGYWLSGTPPCDNCWVCVQQVFGWLGLAGRTSNGTIFSGVPRGLWI